MQEQGLTRTYRLRFDDKDILRKNEIWKVLCKHYFQKYISKNSIVVDIGAGYCEFINNIDVGGGQKYAVDLNSEIANYADRDVIICNCSSTDINEIDDNYADVIFMSNFLEHMNSKEEVNRTVAEAYRILTMDGLLLILQPNIRFCYKDYWDFFDHHVPLSDRSVAEILSLNDFDVLKIVPRFLPFTTKSMFPKHPFFVRLYLLVPFFWKIIGKQAFLLAQKSRKAA